jgi:hypothetical protein
MTALQIRQLQLDVVRDGKGMTRSAVLGGGSGLVNCYRYELRRVWDGRLPLLVVCMLNPSTADADRDDPTIRTLIHFAKLWGYGGILVVNLCAWRASLPAELATCDNPVGPENWRYIERAIATADENGGRLLVAWGNGDFEGRAETFCLRALNASVTLICLGTTEGWRPKHPMARGRHRIPRDQKPVIYREPLRP